MLHWKKYDCPIYVICINESTAVSTIKLINILMNEDKDLLEFLFSCLSFGFHNQFVFL